MLLTNLEYWTILGLLNVGIVFYFFIKNLGISLPILELMLLVAGLQWIVGPFIEYTNPASHHRYYMYVTESTYMSYVVPAYAFFSSIILRGLNKKLSNNFNLDGLQVYSKYGFSLVLIGFISDIALGFLGFFGFILSNLKFVGAAILFFSNQRRLQRAFFLTIAVLFLQAIAVGMFHSFILWSVFFYMFWAYKYKPSLKVKLATLILGVVLLTSLQSIKSAYRAKVWYGYSGNKIELFTSLIFDSLFGQDEVLTKIDDNAPNTNVRLNQGWIISAIMNEIPAYQPYIGGSTIITAVRSSIIPRFLDADKAVAGGRENFRLFTGLEIGERTSMGISIVGEAYGNFGVLGGILFMGIWGWFMLEVWNFLMRTAKEHILLFAFLPLIFLQVVKAETELLVVLNHLIKTSLVVLIVLKFAKSMKLIS